MKKILILEKIKNQTFDLGYDDKFIIPIDYVDIYWSNKGQRGCKEKRLSLRFRIKPDVKKINGYKYVGTDVLEPFTIDVSPKDRDICLI